MQMELQDGAGHSFEIAKKLSNKGRLIGIDRDLEALKAAKEKLKEFSNVEYVHGNHDNIRDILQQLNIDRSEEHTSELQSPA